MEEYWDFDEEMESFAFIKREHSKSILIISQMMLPVFLMIRQQITQEIYKSSTPNRSNPKIWPRHNNMTIAQASSLKIPPIVSKLLGNRAPEEAASPGYIHADR
jgi:hypothetical protein